MRAKYLARPSSDGSIDVDYARMQIRESSGSRRANPSLNSIPIGSPFFQTSLKSLGNRKSEVIPRRRVIQVETSEKESEVGGESGFSEEIQSEVSLRRRQWRRKEKVTDKNGVR